MTSCRRSIHTFIFLILVFIFPGGLHTQWQSIGNVSRVERIDNGIRITAAPAEILLTFISGDIVRVRMSKDGVFGPDSSWAVIQKVHGNGAYTLNETGGEILLSSASLRVRIKKVPCRISFETPDGIVLNEDAPGKGMSWAGNEITVWKTMPENEYYFGFGEKAGMFQRKWHAMTMWNTDIPAYRADTDPLYQTVPFFYTVRDGRTSGIFFDNTYFSHFNMGTDNPAEYSFGAVDGEMNYYFINGPAPADVYARFTGLTGPMPLPPRWTLGYQQCRWSYTPESRVREIASGFRTRNIPCDVLYLDIDYMDGYRCFTWGKDRFPDPARMVSDLGKEGFRMVVIIDPGIKEDTAYWVYQSGLAGDHFVRYPDGKYFTGKVWPGMCVFPDFTRSSTRDWWGSLYRGLTDTGIMGFWNDMNEPSVFDVPGKTFDLTVIHDDNGLRTDHRKNHNIYGMQMARGTYEGLRRLRPNERPFVLTRADYAGGQRYTAAWTGDNVSSWEHLQMALTMCLGLSMSGQPFVGSDIGGFIGKPSGELFARWLQLGVFTPLMRGHSEINSVNKEPWEYGKDFETVNRATIGLRYTFLPYIYTAFQQTANSGNPMMRPLVFDYPDDHQTYTNDREFLFGDALLVAPVLQEGASTRSLRLPPGNWYEYWTGVQHPGNRSLTVDAPVGRLPFFVKAGSIIPTQQVVQYTDQAPADPLTFIVYPDSAGARGEIYEDDGRTFDYQKGVYSKRTISYRSGTPQSELSISNPAGSYTPASRSIALCIYGVTEKPKSVRLDGHPVAEETGGWLYDAGGKILSLSFKDRFREQHLTLAY